MLMEAAKHGEKCADHVVRRTISVSVRIAVTASRVAPHKEEEARPEAAEEIPAGDKATTDAAKTKTSQARHNPKPKQCSVNKGKSM